MHPPDPQIKVFVEMFLRGETDAAFHGLIEMERFKIPELIENFKKAENASLRQFLVNVLWEFRDKSVIPVLAEALRDPVPAVWQEALNGLVTLRSPEALKVLHEARNFRASQQNELFHRWLEEAIGQVED